MSLVWVIYLIDVVCQPWVNVGILIFVGTLVCVWLTVSSCFTTDKQALNSDDEAFFNRAKEGVTASIIAKQSTDVDTVSGATFSSTGIINAVVDALGKAENG